MTTELITSWAEHGEALRRILLELSKSLFIFDEDLTRLNLERAEAADSIRAFLGSNAQSALKIVLRNPEPFRRNSPRLMNLLKSYPEQMTVIEAPPQLLSLSDSIFLVDTRHALIRFHHDHARSRVIIDNASECTPYVKRFEEILREGGEQVSATTLGL